MKPKKKNRDLVILAKLVCKYSMLYLLCKLHVHQEFSDSQAIMNLPKRKVGDSIHKGAQFVTFLVSRLLCFGVPFIYEIHIF